MKKIVTITFNPCIDKNTTIDKLEPEKKLRCAMPTFGPGGGGINVSRVIRKLGGTSLTVFPAGQHTGRHLKDLTRRHELEIAVVETENYTRENLIVYETSTNQQYRFGMPGNEIREEEWMELISIVEENDSDYIVASGSLLPGMPVDIIARIAEVAKRKNSKLVLDTSGNALKKALEVGVYLLKPNLGELSSLVGVDEIDHSKVDELARKIINMGKCEILVVSMGEKGAKLITKTESYQVRSPKVEQVSTLGAGDSMVAGMVFYLSQDKPLKEVLQFGVACGTAATMTPGSELCRKEDVERLFKNIQQARPDDPVGRGTSPPG